MSDTLAVQNLEHIGDYQQNFDDDALGDKPSLVLLENVESSAEYRNGYPLLHFSKKRRPSLFSLVSIS
jgi:phosphate uptake regulator